MLTYCVTRRQMTDRCRGGKVSSGAWTSDRRSTPDPWPADELALEGGGDDRIFGIEQEGVGVGLVAVGEGDDGQVGRLAGLEGPCGRLGPQGPGAEEGGHHQEQPPVQGRVASVEESD